MSYEELTKTLRPADYSSGRGLSEVGEKVAVLLAAADFRAEARDNPTVDCGWGFLTPEALAEDEASWGLIRSYLILG